MHRKLIPQQTMSTSVVAKNIDDGQNPALKETNVPNNSKTNRTDMNSAAINVQQNGAAADPDPATSSRSGEQRAVQESKDANKRGVKR
jgi:hypothetical protein